MTNEKNKARGRAGFDVAAGGQAKATKKKKLRYSGANVIKKVLREIDQKGLRLRSTASDTQLETLPKVLQHFGARGLSTYEGQAAGYLRIATRVKELKATWDIVTLREDVIGPDGLFHKNVGRYVLLGKRKDLPPAQEQQPLDLGGA
ncbi:hypothetical protein [Noviherbaspirillum pedocola]|uniref:Uncharacterized protein n=1 Tax=Noviherbaspirillum pedocola TaxID=2801341 RepID=A0A934SYJ2_9BURK|nr:hypothetical protein [Noviherbaspirillum pedocola]MBK4739216.1 hypothetical protein [Noviherbaspirillum pedocola]